MGARVLYRIKAERNATSQVERELGRRVEAQSATPLGAWEISMATYVATEKNRPPIHILSVSRDIDTTGSGSFVVVTAGGNGMPPQLLSADGELPHLIPKISKYAHKAHRVVKGRAFSLSDFRVRVGLVFEKTNTVGVSVEIEYLPGTTTAQASGLCEALLRRICAPLMLPSDGPNDAAMQQLSSTEFQFSPVAPDSRKFAPSTLDECSDKYVALLYRALLV
mmetsp:Transcript_16529/g.33780  ORF Transcript_16529/g.33780 Transcript_16529/m.33780 type:complete len:222 (-) Transcript_16529:2649-3314(-)